MATLIGKMLGKYKLTELLGRGGMAEVYKARHPQLDRHVTIKVLYSYLAEGEDFLARFTREAKAVAALRHSHIVQIHDFDMQDETYYMVMEFIDGGTLQARMASLAEAGAYMPVEQVLSILRQVAEALDYAHKRSIIHRDIKPSNILLDSAGEAYLADFGIARMLSTTQFTSTGALIGTPTYMSPEQALGEELTSASDLYSLGVILFELLTGKPPFGANTTPLAVIHKHIHEPPPRPSSLRPELAGELEAVILKALSKAPQERYQSAREMARALEKALTPQSHAKLDEHIEPGSSPFAQLPTQFMQEAEEPKRAQLPTELMGEQVQAEMVSPPPPAELSEPEAARAEAAERQNELAAMYVEAVRLMQEGKYQEALEKWQEIRFIDTKYPDRQKVQRMARKGLAAQAKPTARKPGITIPKSLWIGLGSVVAIAVVVFAIYLFGKVSEKAALSGGSVGLPTATKAPVKASATSQPAATKTPSGYADPTMYDDFDDVQYDGSYNGANWSYWRSTGGGGQFAQRNGEFIINMGENDGMDIALAKHQKRTISEPWFIETRIMLDPMKSTANLSIGFEAYSENTYFGRSVCDITNSMSSEVQTLTCGNEYYAKYQQVVNNKNLGATWHLIRIEIDPSIRQVDYYVDGFWYETSVAPEAKELEGARFRFLLGMGRDGSDTSSPNAHIDFVRIGAIEDDPILYDNFDNSKFDGAFNSAKWDYEEKNSKGNAIQEDGALVLTQSGVSQTTRLKALRYWETKIDEPMYFEARLKVDMTRNGFIVLQLWGDVIEAGSCGLHSMSDSAYAHCWTRTEDPGYPVAHGSWHTVRIEVDTDENMSRFFIDGKQLAVDRYEQPIRGSLIWLSVHAHAGPDRTEDTRAVKGYVDDVRIGLIANEAVEPLTGDVGEGAGGSNGGGGSGGGGGCNQGIGTPCP